MSVFEPSTSVWSIPELRSSRLEQSEVASRLLGVMRRWVGYAVGQYRDWDVRPRCGHFFGGSYWYMGETLATAYALAVVSSFGEWDKDAVGVERELVRERIVRSVRYACFTHDTGPRDCVRVESKLRYVSGRKWGGEGDNFFMATQNGRSIALLAHIALLMRAELDTETRMLVQNVIASYADRWSEENPHTGTYYDTQCEEDGWTAAGIGAAAIIFPEHPHQPSWQEGMQRWARNVITLPLDRARHPHGLIDRPAGDSIQTVNFHPDCTAENHGFVHPAYMCAGINLRSLCLTLATMTGTKPDEVLTLNNEQVYEKTVRYWTLRDGVIAPVQGQDWWYNRQHDALVTHAVMSVFHDNPEAALFERDALAVIEGIQNSNDRGCLLEAEGEQCVINAAHGQYANQLEHGTAAELASAALLHLFGGPGAMPADREEIEARLKGVRVYPFGGVVIHRTPQSFSSFSWRNHVLAYTAPAAGLWDVTPHYLSYLGSIRLEGQEDYRQKEAIIDWAENLTLTEKREGFVLTVEAPRCGGRLQQRLLFASLPDGRSVYVERIGSRSGATVERMATGLIGVRNEHYAAVRSIAPGRKRLVHPDGELEFEGFYGSKPDRIERLPGCAWVNLDEHVGYLLHGSAGIEYLNRHVYEKWRGVEDQLVLNHRAGFRIAAESWLPPFGVVTIPNQRAAETARARLASRLLDAGGEAVAIEVDGTLIYGQFAEEAVSVRAGAELKAHLYPGRQEISASGWRWSRAAGSRQTDYLHSVASVSFEDPETRVSAIVTGPAFVLENAGERSVEISLEYPDGSDESLSIAPGGLVRRG